MDHNNTTNFYTTAIIADPPYRTNPELILVFTPKGMKCHVFNTCTAEEEGQIRGLLEQIQPCLDIANAIIKQSSAVAGRKDG